MMKPNTLIPSLAAKSMLTRAMLVLCLGICLAAGAGRVSAREPGVRELGAPGEPTEVHLPTDQPPVAWVHDPAIFEEDEGDRTEVREVVEQDVKTVKLDNLVPPVYFGLGDVEITQEYINLLQEVLDSMRDRTNLRLHFIGHADALPLQGDLKARYGDNLGLSRERAGTVAEYCQQALDLPPEAVSYEGLGDSRPVADNATEEGRRLNRRVEVEIWFDEMVDKQVSREVMVPSQVKRIKVCRTETVCKLRFQEGHALRACVKNLVQPLQYNQAMADVPALFLQQIRQAMTNLRGKQNLMVKFIAYTDNMPLKGRDKRIYGGHDGISKAVARRMALAVQESLGLPDGAVASEGRGATRPVASNDTQQGRAQNRRIEVEFWHDDPLEDLPDEPQLCPDAAGTETVTRVYESPGGSVDAILFENGRPVIPPGYTAELRRIMDEISDKSHVRIKFTGYTGNQRLDRRTAAIYGDDIGLSMARARRAMQAVLEQMDLGAEQAEFDGRGYVQSDDVVNAGFIESDISRVRVQVVYDELVQLDDYEGVDVSPLTREVETQDPFALNLMRITVDGAPLDDPGKCSADVQRCTDVALENTQIQFKFDSLAVAPRLNVTAWPTTIGYQDSPDTAFVENLVHFRLYTNYRSFIERAEVRIFREEQSVHSQPLAVVEMDADGTAQWQARLDSFAAPLIRLQYRVRVYDAEGHFDETSSQLMWVVDHVDPPDAETIPRQELLSGYGESRLETRNIKIRGGMVQAHGHAVPEDHGIWMAGHQVPVDNKGSFVAEEILPPGMHTVELAVLDPFGNGELFLRDLTLKPSDWFTVGIADMTLSGNDTNGPAPLLAPDEPRYSEDSSLEGRLAFYSKGKFDNGWHLTASADTREGPFDEIFSNFMEKSPDALFRRMDPDYHYPTFGDDSTVEEDAPTSGKFYVKMKKDETYGLWGNYRIGYTDNDLSHVDRGLYGANLHYQPLETMPFGEPRLLVDGFAADPGTVAGRDELRGTGGSLYYLSRQDVLPGSERLRIEVRDKDSGVVLGVKNLVPALDYDIDYLQGRILMAQPLSTTADDNLLVATVSISGNPVFLVARYEFTPGFEDPDTLAAGGRLHYWLNDYVKVGATASEDEEADTENSLQGLDLTLRGSSESWIKLETGRTEGPGSRAADSDDGGYNFEAADPLDDSETEASAYRIDASLGVKDIIENGRGRLTVYTQEREAGYAAPGQATDRDITQYGGTADMPLGDSFAARVKVDKQVQQDGLETDAGEVNLDYNMTENWILSSGVRHDKREDNSAVVPLTQEVGERTDAVVKMKYDSLSRWTSYGFVQDTVNTTGNRDENGRVGVGGDWRLTERLNLLGEVSEGDLGPAGKIGTEYLYSDRTTLYQSYTLENERSDNGLLARKGNLTSGFRSRYSDSMSMFLEERYSHGDIPTGLTHSTGVDLAVTQRLNLGANLDFGTLKDPQTAAEIDRKTVGGSLGYGFDHVKFASGLEYRVDENEQPDTSFTKRTTWLFKNNLKYQISQDWRLLGKFNYSLSKSSLGDFYDGDYTEAVAGFGYRPIYHDRLNALLKYTYFYNLPPADQMPDGNTSVGYIQRSHIGAIDIMYDLTSRWTVGGKYAYRHGQAATDRAQPDYFDSRAHLYVLRADWHFIHRWDALLEGRLLDLPDAQDRRSGVLVGLYRHVGDHVKFGVGYNFSDFSDDLTQMDYRHQGVFINIVGKY